MQKNTDTDRPAAPPIEIDHVIAQLAGHQAYLATHIDRHWDDLEPLQLARTLSLYGQNAARLGRLFLDRAAAYGADCDEWQAERQDAWRRMDAELYGGSFDTAAAIGEDDAAAGGAITARDDASAQASPDIDAVITDLSASQDRLSNYLERCRDDLDPRPMERLLAVYSQNAARLGRLLRYRSDIFGPRSIPSMPSWTGPWTSSGPRWTPRPRPISTALTHPLNQQPIHSPIRSPTHSLTRSWTR